jgi:small GTP-binding protein
MEFFEELEKNGVKTTPEQRKAIEERFIQSLHYEPTIGFFGKTGVGKSSLCNALFGQDICKINDVKACTRDPKKILANISGKGITLMDVPGVGESIERDEEYAELYANLLPELDLCLWVLKADDRALASEEKFYRDIVTPHLQEGKPFLFALNQVDKIEPVRDWDEENKKPGNKQEANIDVKKADVSHTFNRRITEVIPVSANEKYHLVELMNTIIHSLPPNKRFTAYHNVPKENRSKEQEEIINKDMSDQIRAIIREELGDRAEHETKVIEKSSGDRFLDFLGGLAKAALEIILRPKIPGLPF